jgi:hypothetical protein
MLYLIAETMRARRLAAPRAQRFGKKSDPWPYGGICVGIAFLVALVVFAVGLIVTGARRRDRLAARV